MIKIKYFLPTAVLCMALTLFGCGNTTPANTSETVNEEVSETEKEEVSETEKEEVSETEKEEVSETEKEEVPENEEAPIDSETESERFNAQLSLAQSVGPDGCAVFEVQNLIYITMDDTDLIEKYGLAPDLDGYDYEVVNSEEGPQMLTAFEDCHIEIIDWENGKTEYEAISLEDFCDYLMESNGPLNVIYEKDDLDTVTFIMVDYAG